MKDHLSVNTAAQPFRRRPLAVALSVAAALAASTPLLVQAQQASQQATSASRALHNFTIPAQALSEALILFGQQSGLQVSASSELVEGKQARAVSGSLSAEQALGRLLGGSGLSFQVSGNMVSLRASDDAAVLPAMLVSGTAMASGSAERGYVSEVVSQVGPWQGRSLQDTPYSLSIASQELINNTLAGDMDQIYKMNPLVQASAPTTVTGLPYAVFRGFHNQKAVLDGIKLSSYATGITMEEVEQVEILSGLSGFMYGAGNVGGTTNFVLKRPTYEQLTNVRLGNYGNEQWFGHLDLGNKLDEQGRFAYRLNLAAQDGETGKQDQNVEKQLVSGALDWNVTEDLLLQFEAAHSTYRVDKFESRFYAYADASRAPLDHWIEPLDNDRTYTPDWAFLDTETDRGGVNLTYDINQIFTLRAAYLYKKDTTEERGNYPMYLADSGWVGGWNYYSAPADHISQGSYVYLDSHFRTGSVEHKLTTGFFGDWYEQRAYENGSNWGGNSPVYTNPEDLENYDVIPTIADLGRRYTPTKTSNRNLVIGDDVQFNEQWSALIGVNYATLTAYSYNADGSPSTPGYDKAAVTPSLSLIYKPFAQLTTYLSYVEALEPGTIVGGSYANAGDVLDPLISKQYEVGLKYSLNDSLLLTSALYRIEKANEFSDDGTPTGRYVQDGMQVHQGIELTLTGKVTDNLTLIGGGSLMDLGIEDSDDKALEGKKPNNTASRLAKLYAEYQIPGLPGLTLTGGAYYTGPVYKDVYNRQEIDSYLLYDAGVRYQTAINDTDLSFNLNLVNLTDEDYWASEYSLGVPRTLAFAVSAGF
ncbi:TonB-dependent siderophore receptor [Halopseudomonas pachastrellae]|uniref:TonB-dependent siderophore receptor n=1 Tax=Halopseudomonas pachastrellae TaxID=254161 RepID=UPI003D7C9E46